MMLKFVFDDYNNGYFNKKKRVKMSKEDNNSELKVSLWVPSYNSSV